MDPTFDPPGPHDYLDKLTGPAVSADALGQVDVVLVSHDQHPDNLDNAGRRLAEAAPLIVTNPVPRAASGRRRWGYSHGSLTTCRADQRIAAQAVPAVHGPADGMRDMEGHVNCEVTGFVLYGPNLPDYLSQR